MKTEHPKERREEPRSDARMGAPAIVLCFGGILLLFSVSRGRAALTDGRHTLRHSPTRKRQGQMRTLPLRGLPFGTRSPSPPPGTGSGTWR